MIVYYHPHSSSTPTVKSKDYKRNPNKNGNDTSRFWILRLDYQKVMQKNRSLFMGMANQSQTESCQVFHDSGHSYEQYISYCIIYIFYIITTQLSLNTMLFYTAVFCRNFKGIQSGKPVFNIFDIYVFLNISAIFYSFHAVQIKL